MHFHLISISLVLRLGDFDHLPISIDFLPLGSLLVSFSWLLALLFWLFPFICLLFSQLHSISLPFFHFNFIHFTEITSSKHRSIPNKSGVDRTKKVVKCTCATRKIGSIKPSYAFELIVKRQLAEGYIEFRYIYILLNITFWMCIRLKLCRLK